MIPSKPPPTFKSPDQYSSNFRTFLTRCLTKDQNARPSAEELLHDPFILGATTDQVLSEKVLRTAEAIQAKQMALLQQSKESDDESEYNPGTISGTIRPSVSCTIIFALNLMT